MKEIALPPLRIEWLKALNAFPDHSKVYSDKNQTVGQPNAQQAGAINIYIHVFPGCALLNGANLNPDNMMPHVIRAYRQQ